MSLNSWTVPAGFRFPWSKSLNSIIPCPDMSGLPGSNESIQAQRHNHAEEALLGPDDPGAELVLEFEDHIVVN